MRVLTCVAILSLGILGCPSEKRVAEPDAGAEIPDAGATPEPFAIEIIGEAADAGTVVLDPDSDEVPMLPAVHTLELSTNAPIRDWRIRVFDEADRVVISDDTFEMTPSGLQYRIVFPEPLKTGYRYTLLLDAQTGVSVLDAEGEPLPDHRIEFQIEGEKQKPPPKKNSRRRR